MSRRPTTFGTLARRAGCRDSHALDGRSTRIFEISCRSGLDASRMPLLLAYMERPPSLHRVHERDLLPFGERPQLADERRLVHLSTSCPPIGLDRILNGRAYEDSSNRQAGGTGTGATARTGPSQVRNASWWSLSQVPRASNRSKR